MCGIERTIDESLLTTSFNVPVMFPFIIHVHLKLMNNVCPASGGQVVFIDICFTLTFHLADRLLMRQTSVIYSRLYINLLY